MVRKPGFPVDRDGFKVAYEIDDEMTFESFIQSLENHHIFSNPHFSNQASIAYDPDIRFDRVFDIERIDTDYLDNLFHTSIEQPGRSPITLYRHYDGEKPVCQLSIRELDQLHFKPAYRQFYNPAIRNKIEELYEKDFRLFERLGFSYKID